MSTPPFGPWTFWQRWLAGKELRHDSDTPPPPPGFASWVAYYLQIVKGELPLTTFETPITVVQGRKLSVVWTRTGEDVATIGMHFVHRDGPDVVPFTGDDCAAVEGHFTDLWDGAGGLKGFYSPEIALDRYVWHDFGVDVRKPNPHVRETVLGAPVIGTAEDKELPLQTAVSITFKTSVRRNWGRVYMPAPNVNVLAVGGSRLDDDVVDSYRTHFGTFADACADDHLPLVIWSPRHAGAALQFFKRDADHPESAHALNLDNPDASSFARTVDNVQVDDIPDVIRSRRLGKAEHYASHSVT